MRYILHRSCLGTRTTASINNIIRFFVFNFLIEHWHFFVFVFVPFPFCHYDTIVEWKLMHNIKICCVQNHTMAAWLLELYMHELHVAVTWLDWIDVGTSIRSLFGSTSIVENEWQRVRETKKNLSIEQNDDFGWGSEREREEDRLKEINSKWQNEWMLNNLMSTDIGKVIICYVDVEERIHKLRFHLQSITIPKIVDFISTLTHTHTHTQRSTLQSHFVDAKPNSRIYSATPSMSHTTSGWCWSRIK